MNQKFKESLRIKNLSVTTSIEECLFGLYDVSEEKQNQIIEKKK